MVGPTLLSPLSSGCFLEMLVGDTDSLSQFKADLVKIFFPSCDFVCKLVLERYRLFMALPVEERAGCSAGDRDRDRNLSRAFERYSNINKLVICDTSKTSYHGGLFWC